MDNQPLEKMLAEGQDNHLIRYTLGSLYLKKAQYGQAIEQLEMALKHNRNHSASWKLYGKALAQDGRSAEAATAYEQGIQVAETLGDIQAAKEMKVFLRRLEPQQPK